jgi:hypothetical protein
MRIPRFLCACFFLLLLLTGLSAAQAAQDTNFSTGPQYLLTGSPLFARPIATPGLSLGAPLPEPPTAITYSAPTEQETFANLSAVERPPNLSRIFYGVPSTSEIEISFPASLKMPAVPPNFLDTGVSEITDMDSLRVRGYGVTLGEYARYWKGHRTSAQRHFTNEDIERLHKAS